MTRKSTIVTMWLWLGMGSGLASAGPSGVFSLPPAPGSYISPTWSDFTGPSYQDHDFVVGTFFFFWYNVKTGAHIVDPDGTDACTTHYWRLIPGSNPPQYQTPPVFSYDEMGWVDEQIQDMLTARIDFMMPVFWGVPGLPETDWNISGVKTITQTLLKRDGEGKSSPQVGLFYDDSTLNGVDLSSTAGKEKFYGTIRDFYSMVPPMHWARMNDKAIVWIYASSFPSVKSAEAFSEAKTNFQAEFGGVDLFFVGDEGWLSVGDPIDRTYSWGGCFAPTLKNYCDVGPGFDNTAVPWGDPGLTAPRNGGERYQSGWAAVTDASCRVAAVETWNEWHESTDVAHSYEYGTDYINLTAISVIRFKFKGSMVRALYRYFLAREPDAGGFWTYTEQLRSTPPHTIRDGILGSQEFKDLLTDREYATFLFQHYLHRDPDPAGLDSLTQFLASGNQRSEARDNLLDSAEALTNVSNAEFVTEMYRQMLFREPDTDGYNTHLGALTSGTKRSDVRDTILNSLEFQYKEVGNRSLQELLGVLDFNGYPSAQNTCTFFYQDADADGYGGAREKCLYSSSAFFDTDQGGDCHDADAAIHPGATEACDGIDNNCDGRTDDLGTETCGAGACTNTVARCVSGETQACNPLQAPETSEASCSDAVDNDCDGKTDLEDPDCSVASEEEVDGGFDAASGTEDGSTPEDSTTADQVSQDLGEVSQDIQGDGQSEIAGDGCGCNTGSGGSTGLAVGLLLSWLNLRRRK